MRLRRRMIPWIVALLISSVWISVIGLDTLKESRADRLTLLNLAVGYAIKAGIFFYMRRRMMVDTRELTIFGAALIDFFSGLILFAVILATISFVMYAFAVTMNVPSFYVRMFYRIAINAGIWLIIGTGAAVIFEMRRGPERLEVHEG